MGLFGFGNKEEVLPAFWGAITNENELDEALALAQQKTVLLFKHSTRCSISSMAFNRLKSNWKDCEIVPYYLDLIAYRNISNTIADKLNVIHQSPQVILLKNGKVVYHASHSQINFDAILEHE